MSVVTSQRVDLEETLAGFPEHSLTTSGGRVSWREAGSGPAVVLLHGISSGSASWIHQLTGLSPELRIIAWDAPGYGGSTPLATETPLASDYANALARLVDALALERVTLVGHSLGAMMAAAYASANPQRVQRLVLMSPARGYAMADRDDRERRCTDRLSRMDRLGPEGLARERAAALLSPAATSDAIAWVAWNMRRLNPDGYRQAARMLADDDIGRYAGGYPGPVTVLSGSADTITPTEKCRAVTELFASATYECISGPGHALYLEDPVRINRFLQRQALP